MKISRTLIFALSTIIFLSSVTKTQSQVAINEETQFVELSNFMNEIMDLDSFSGVVLILNGNEIFFQEAYGMADKSKGIINNINTKFNIGSCAKMFTAFAIVQLVEQGKLSFDDTIDKYLDELPAEAVGKITVEHLLTHTSGLGDIFTPTYLADMDNIDTVEGFVSYIISQPLRMEPGTRFNYSNGGYVVLGRIIEIISGEDYYSYIRNNIFIPLGMIDTDFYSKNDNVPNLARGYINTNRQPLPPPPQDGQPRPIPPSDNRNAVWEDNFSTLPLIGNPSGGAYSSAEDLFKFATALMGHTLLSEEYTNTLLTGKVNTTMGEYGYGFEVLVSGGHNTIGHSGGAPGISALFRILTNENCIVILLSNYGEGVRSIEREIFNQYIPR
ncbi:MAG: beta-lactamase family protein [Candidatus Cloacimonetes bacterium]|nr:beta-lactamase family protein [Candidatus Cloacimonadota bacterium]